MLFEMLLFCAYVYPRKDPDLLLVRKSHRFPSLVITWSFLLLHTTIPRCWRLVITLSVSSFHISVLLASGLRSKRSACFSLFPAPHCYPPAIINMFLEWNPTVVGKCHIVTLCWGVLPEEGSLRWEIRRFDNQNVLVDLTNHASETLTKKMACVSDSRR